MACGQTDAMPELHGSISVTNNFEPVSVEVIWDLDHCDSAIEFTFDQAAADRYTLTGRRPVSCPTDRGSLPIAIRSGTPVLAEMIEARLVDPDAPASTIPPPVVTTATPDPRLSARERIDQFWLPFDDIVCMGMVPSESLEEDISSAELIVTGRPVGVQAWEDPHQVNPNYLVTIEVTDVLKGEPTYVAPGFIQLIGSGVPSDVIVSDLDHLLLLMPRTRYYPADAGFYYLSDGYVSVYADVDGKVVTPERAAIKRIHGNHIVSVALDGTSFDKLLERVRRPPATGSEGAVRIAQHGYFAC